MGDLRQGDLPDFHGEVVIVYLNTRERSCVLKDPHLETTAGRTFVCGTMYYPAYPDHWSHTRRCCIGLDSISDYVEFTTAQDYVKAKPSGLRSRRRQTWLVAGSAVLGTAVVMRLLESLFG